MDRNNQREIVIKLMSRVINKDFSQDAMEAIDDFLNLVLDIETPKDIETNAVVSMATFILFLHNINIKRHDICLKVEEASSHLSQLLLDIHRSIEEPCNVSERSSDVKSLNDISKDDIIKDVFEPTDDYCYECSDDKGCKNKDSDCNEILKDFGSNGFVLKRYLPDDFDGAFTLPERGKTAVLNIEDEVAGIKFKGKVIIDSEGYVKSIMQPPKSVQSVNLDFEDLYSGVIDDILRYKGE